ncbi:MAG: hypothetical protein QMD46_11235 [Methanomicrobiales archaeon]|nr:hypothetical protein [Methanomicrobiales archaeon]MDI6876938.1 hypothetical protein [Methanomicrobiales archaeon]
MDLLFRDANAPTSEVTVTIAPIVADAGADPWMAAMAMANSPRARMFSPISLPAKGVW